MVLGKNVINSFKVYLSYDLDILYLRKILFKFHLQRMYSKYIFLNIVMKILPPFILIVSKLLIIESSNNKLFDKLVDNVAHKVSYYL